MQLISAPDFRASYYDHFSVYIAEHLPLFYTPLNSFGDLIMQSGNNPVHNPRLVKFTCERKKPLGNYDYPFSPEFKCSYRIYTLNTGLYTGHNVEIDVPLPKEILTIHLQFDGMWRGVFCKYNFEVSSQEVEITEKIKRHLKPDLVQTKTVQRKTVEFTCTLGEKSLVEFLIDYADKFQDVKTFLELYNKNKTPIQRDVVLQPEQANACTYQLK